MDPDAPSVPVSPPALLKSYKWRTATPGPGGDPQKLGVFPQKLGGSPGSRRWARLQGWRRSHSHPDTVGDSSGDRGGGDRGGGDKGGDRGGDRGVAKASARRSLFRRAISAPCKAGKVPPLGTPPVSLGTSPPPLVAPVPPDATQVWDVSQFSLLDGHLVPLPRDNEQGPWRSRTRAGSATSDGTNAGRRDPDPDERGPRAEPPPSSQLSNVKGLLWKRLLRDRRSRGATKGDHGVVAAPDGDRVPSRSGSRESLVPPPELDLTGDNVIVRPVHGSLVGERFCFQVITPAGSRSFGCSSLAERDRWIEELRRTAQPNKDNCERLDLSLSLSLFEGRHLPARRRLRCLLQLDGAVFARTTAKPPGGDGQLFWGELFHLAALPPARALTVTLCQHQQHQHHHDDPAGWHPVASVTIPLAELAAWQPLERWYTLSGAGVAADPAPALRLRGRYRRVRVLPIVRYKELAEFVTFHYRELCGRLEPAIAARHKEELAGALVRVLQSTGKAKSFLTDLGVAELDRLDDHEALIFRENTLATKAIDEYMKLVGAKYLQDTLGEVVAQLCSSEQSFEVDPSKVSGPELSEHQQHLRQVCEETLRRITDGSESFPSELAEVFSAWWDACAARGKEDIGRRLVSASLFLRFLCPAIMSPSLFGLVQEYPGEATARSLTLVAKVIQNLANFTTFGDKEPYMTFMNGFLEHHWATMTEFLHAVSTPESSAHMATYDGVVDLALELATLHLLLCDIFSSLDQATQEELEPLPTILRAIREGTPVPVSVQLSSTTGRSPSEPPRPGFLPPRDPPKHSPLLKSQSLTSVRRLRAHDEGTTTVPPPVPPPVPPSGTPPGTPPGTPELVPARRRRHVQRTQSVPAQGKGARCPPEGDSAAEGTVTPPGGGTGAPGSGDGPPRGKLRSSASLPRKPSVPWQRLAEDAAAPGELYGLRPLEKHGRLLEALRAELAELRQRLERAEARAARTEERHRERLERLRGQLDEGNARAANLAARLTAAEGTRRKDLERLKSNEERGRELERRLSGLEQELRRARGHHGVPKVSPGCHHEPDNDSDATSV